MTPRARIKPGPGQESVWDYPRKLDACFVDDEQVQANEGSFYGGWITSNVVGPFQGRPRNRRLVADEVARSMRAAPLDPRRHCRRRQEDSYALAHPRRTRHRDLRVPRGVPQPPAPALRSRHAHPSS